MNSGDAAVGSHIGIRSCLCFLSTVLPYMICNADEEPCPKTDSIFGIYDVPALGNYRMNHH